MMDNMPCTKWLTTSQDEYRDPACVKVYRNIENEEMARYEKCMKEKADAEELLRNEARSILCCNEQSENREPVIIPTDSHINPCIACKPKWCRCLATGDPNCYDEQQEELATDAECYCRMVTHQMDGAFSDIKTNNSNYFIDYRDPAYNYIGEKLKIKLELEGRHLAYKAKADKKDEEKEPKIVLPSPSHPHYGYLKESDACLKGITKKYVWTSTYREMNKDGAALPLAVREIPESCIERPPGDPMRLKAELAEKSLFNLGQVFEKWDRPQVRTMAHRCHLMSVNPNLDHDAYFQEHRLCRTKFARCMEGHAQPSAENIRLARENRLRMPYDRLLPGYAGYPAIMVEAPPVCKIHKILNPYDPYEDISTYGADYRPFDCDVYENRAKPYAPSEFHKMGISTNPIFPLMKLPLPCVRRLSCYIDEPIVNDELC